MTRKPPSELFDEHKAINALCEDVVARAETGDWKLCDAIWDEFARRLEAHMQLEEQKVFPRYLRAHPERRLAVAELEVEHAEFRGTIRRMGEALQLMQLRADDVRRLVGRIEQHANAENRELYPWVERQRAQAHGPTLD